jgi:hypothetical protein
MERKLSMILTHKQTLSWTVLPRPTSSPGNPALMHSLRLLLELQLHISYFAHKHPQLTEHNLQG